MTNGVVIALFSILAVMTLTMMVITMVRLNKQHAVRSFLLVAAEIFCWQITEIIYFVTMDEALALRLFDVKLIFVAMAPVQLLIFVMRFYRLDRMLTKGFRIAIFIIPVLTILTVLTRNHHNLIRKELYMLQMSPIHLEYNVRGTWFWVHSVYSYVILMVVGCMILYFYRKLPKGWRMSSVLLLSGIFSTIISNLLIIFGIIRTFDFTLVGMSIALVFVFVVVSGNDSSEFLIMARNDIFSFLEEYVFILDNNRRVLDANPAAMRWLKTLAIESMDKLQFDEVTSRLNRAESFAPSDQDTADNAMKIFLTDEEHPVVLNLREHAVLNEAGTRVGMFATFSDVTRYKMMIDRLEEAAGIDPLTGLANRRTYESSLQELDTVENLPLSVILGDVNGLKQVNDTMGHHCGDALLRAVAKVLERCCGELGQVARIGGDEFVLLLPHTDEKQAAELVRRIEQELKSLDVSEDPQYRIQPSFAMGIATKNSGDEELEALVREADLNMYTSKNMDRRRNRRSRGPYQFDTITEGSSNDHISGYQTE